MKGKTWEVHKGFKLPSLASKTRCIDILEKEENGCSSDAQPNK